MYLSILNVYIYVCMYVVRAILTIWCGWEFSNGGCKCGPCVHIDAADAHFDVRADAVTCVARAVSAPVVTGADHAVVGSVAGAAVNDHFIIMPCDVEYIWLPLLLVLLYTCESENTYLLIYKCPPASDHYTISKNLNIFSIIYMNAYVDKYTYIDLYMYIYIYVYIFIY